MKIRHLLATAFAAALLTCVTVQAQEDHSRFNDHDRQAAQEWYSQHQNHPSRGFRSTDRLSTEQEGMITEGQPLSREMRHRSYSVPSDLRSHLARAPRHYQYLAVGGHVVLVDQNYVVHDVIHLHDRH